MTPPSPPDSTLALAFVLLMVAPVAVAGVALVNTGLGRSRSAAQSLLGCVAIFSLGVLCFAVVGGSFAAAQPSAAFHLAGRSWNWIGLGPILFAHFGEATPQTQLQTLFELIAAGFVGLIPWGAGADRLRLAAGLLIAAVLALFFFPLAAHWAWNAGWLAQLDANFAIGVSFADPAGAASVHVLGGLAALAAIWVTGPRKGKFPREGLATAMPAHNAVYVLFGCLVALVGWLAWNAAGAILFLNATPAALPTVAFSTLLAACGSMLATLMVTRLRFGKPDASLCTNGWLAGLVTSSASAALVSPEAALAIGILAGFCNPLIVELLELAFSIDDPTGAIAVHAAAGLWGLFATGVFASHHGQFLAQMIGIAAMLGIFLPLAYLLFTALNRIVPFRVDPDGERLGMDLQELGGGAFPEFVIHRDESYR